MLLAAALAMIPARALAQDCKNPDCRPDVIPAADRKTPPPGFHRETHNFQGPMIGAVACWAVGGAWMVMGADPENPASGLMLIMGGATFATGLGLATFALVAREEVFVRDRVELSITPVVSSRLAGGALRLAF